MYFTEYNFYSMLNILCNSGILEASQSNQYLEILYVNSCFPWVFYFVVISIIGKPIHFGKRMVVIKHLKIIFLYMLMNLQGEE